MHEHLENQTFTDGKQVWKVARLFKLAEDLKPFKIPLKHLNITNLYPRQIDTTLEFVDHVRQVHEADLAYPIILDEEGYVMDGRHRVIKSLLEKKDSIKAVRFDETPRCCYVKD